MPRVLMFWFLLIGMVPVLASPVLAGPAQGRETAFVMEEPEGGVVRTTAEGLQKSPVDLMEFLSPGDRLELSAGALVEVYYLDSGIRETAEGPGVLVIGLTESRGEMGLRVEVRQPEQLPVSVRVRENDVQRMGALILRGRPDQPPGTSTLAWILSRLESRKQRIEEEYSLPHGLKPLSLVYTATSLVCPVFRWQPQEQGRVYRLVLFDGQGRKLLEIEGLETQFHVPEPGLKAGGHYLWTVEALNDIGGTVAMSESKFWLPEAPVLEAVARCRRLIIDATPPQSDETALALLMLDIQYELYDEAAALLRPLLTKHPKNENLNRLSRLLMPGGVLASEPGSALEWPVR